MIALPFTQSPIRPVQKRDINKEFLLGVAMEKPALSRWHYGFLVSRISCKIMSPEISAAMLEISSCLMNQHILDLCSGAGVCAPEDLHDEEDSFEYLVATKAPFASIVLTAKEGRNDFHFLHDGKVRLVVVRSKDGFHQKYITDQDKLQLSSFMTQEFRAH